MGPALTTRSTPNLPIAGCVGLPIARVRGFDAGNGRRTGGAALYSAAKIDVRPPS